MNIDEYFLRSRHKIPPKENRNLAKTSGPEATVSMPDSSPEEEEQQQVQANTEFVLDAAFRQTIQEITANLTRVTDEKLGPLFQIEERTAEAENRIAAAVHTSEMVKTRVSELKKQIQSMA